jgi:hypothetical protein
MSEKPTDQQLRDAAHRNYGVSCSQGHCKARGDDRGLSLDSDLHADRDEAFGGTWVSVRVWIPDDDIRPVMP